MTGETPHSGFSDVDNDAKPSELIRLLDLRHENQFHRAYRQRAIELLTLHAGDHVLDIGCGTGDDVHYLAEIVGPGGLAVGVDSSSRMIQEALARHGQSNLPVSYHVGDASQLEFDNESFDGCLAVRTFQHLGDPPRALAELVRVLRPGRRIAVVDPDHDLVVIDSPYRSLMRKFLNFRADTIRNGGIAHHMAALFRQHGLLAVSVIPMTEVRTEYASVEASSHYEGGIRVARDHGVLTTEDADHLIIAMRDAAASDRFFTSMTYFLTVGTKA